jgi:hypothetical protein
MIKSKSKRKTWAGHLDCSEERESAEILAGRTKYNIVWKTTTTTMMIKETVKKMKWDVKGGIRLAQNKERGCAKVKRVIKTQVTQNAWNCLVSRATADSQEEMTDVLA